jgi:hypothetical protein
MNLEKFRNPASAMMNSIYYPGCSITIPDPTCSDCPDKELAGIRGFALIKETFAFTDPSNIVEWQAGIQSKDIYMYPKSRGSLEQAPTESQGWGDQAMVTDGNDFIVSAFEPNFADNVDHWNVMKKSNGFKLAWRTETKLFITDVAVVITPLAPFV